jgi:hypothetical protein
MPHVLYLTSSLTFNHQCGCSLHDVLSDKDSVHCTKIRTQSKTLILCFCGDYLKMVHNPGSVKPGKVFSFRWGHTKSVKSRKMQNAGTYHWGSYKPGKKFLL